MSEQRDRERAEICNREGKGVFDLIQECECKLRSGGSRGASIVGNGGSHEQQRPPTTPTTRAPTHGQAAQISPTEAWATQIGNDDKQQNKTPTTTTGDERGWRRVGKAHEFSVS